MSFLTLTVLAKCELGSFKKLTPDHCPAATIVVLCCSCGGGGGGGGGGRGALEENKKGERGRVCSPSLSLSVMHVGV
jgi:hypothetical protein